MIDLKSNFKVDQKDLKCQLMTSMKRISKACCYICTALNPEPVRTPLYTDLFSEKNGQTSKVSIFDFF